MTRDQKNTIVFFIAFVITLIMLMFLSIVHFIETPDPIYTDNYRDVFDPQCRAKRWLPYQLNFEDWTVHKIECLIK